MRRWYRLVLAAAGAGVDDGYGLMLVMVLAGLGHSGLVQMMGTK
jgi:hypothetical protein